jgi:hypothetical protein
MGANQLSFPVIRLQCPQTNYCHTQNSAANHADRDKEPPPQFVPWLIGSMPEVEGKSLRPPKFSEQPTKRRSTGKSKGNRQFVDLVDLLPRAIFRRLLRKVRQTGKTERVHRISPPKCQQRYFHRPTAAVKLIGFVLQLAGLIYLGVLVFSFTVLFQLVNLPVEFDASRRARIALVENGMVTAEEDPVVGRVLNAAALTYVAGTLTAVLQLLYFVFRSGLLGRRD